MSQYPVLSQPSGLDVLSAISEHYASEDTTVFPSALVELRGSGAMMDLAPVRLACAIVTAARKSGKWLGGVGKAADEFEAEVASDFHSHLHTLSQAALGDPDFWRWMAVACLWDDTLWRYKWKEGATIRPWWFGIGDGYWRALPVSLFLRVEIAIAAAASTGAVTGSLLTGTDSVGLWQDQLYAVETGSSPSVVAAFVKARQTGRLAGKNKSVAIKAIGRAINNLRSSVLTETLDHAGGESLLETAFDVTHTG